MSDSRSQSLFALLPSVRAKGPPLVCLHGFLGQPTAFSEILKADLPRGPAALVRLPGHGPEPWMPVNASFEDLADAITGALPFESPAFLLGYSMGARLSLAMIARHPQRFLGAILIGVHPGLTTKEEREERAQWEASMARRLSEEGLMAFVNAWEKLPLFATQGHLSETTKAAQRAERLDHTKDGIAWAISSLGLSRMPSYWAALRSNRRPLYWIAGALDAKNVELAERASMRALMLSTRIVQNVGHNVLLESPKTVVDLLDRALD